MTTMTLARQAVRLYPRTEYCERKSINHLRRAWIEKVLYLGDKWLIAKSIPKKEMQDG